MPRHKFQRRVDERAKQPAILIVCEGTRTEFYYFRALKEDFSLRSVHIKPIGRDPLSLVRAAAHEARAQGINQVWCVFDHEFAPQNVQFAPAVVEAEDRGFRLAVSNPSFEFWLLLHYVPSTGQFDDNDQLEEALRARCPQYEKNWKGCYEELRPLQPQAIANADLVLAHHQRTDPGTRFPHPSTNVHQLVQRLATPHENSPTITR